MDAVKSMFIMFEQHHSGLGWLASVGLVLFFHVGPSSVVFEILKIRGK